MSKTWKRYSLQHTVDFVEFNPNRVEALAHMELSRATYDKLKYVLENANSLKVNSIEEGKAHVSVVYSELKAITFKEFDPLCRFSLEEKDAIGDVTSDCASLIVWGMFDLTKYLAHLGKKNYGDKVQVNAINAHYRLMVVGHSSNYFQLLGINYSSNMDKQLGL